MDDLAVTNYLSNGSAASGDKKVATLEWKGWNYLYCKVKQFPDAKNPF